MREKISKESLMNLLTATLLSLLLMYFSTSLGEIIAALQIFPFIVLYVNEDWKLTVVSMVVTFALGILLINPINLLYMALYIVSLTFFIGNAIKTKKSLTRTILYGAFIKLVFTLALFIVGYLLTKQNPIETFRTVLYQMADHMQDTLSSNLDSAQINSDELARNIKASIDAAVSITPALIFISSYLVVAINTFVAMKVLDKTGYKLAYSSKMNHYGTSIDLKTASIVLGISALIVYLFNLGIKDLFIDNVFSVLSFFYFVNGILLTDYIYEITGHKILRFLVPIGIIFVLQVPTAFIFIGFADMVFNFRGRVKLNAKK